MPGERISYLVEQFFRHSCTEAEKLELANWIEQSATDAALKEVLEDAWQKYEPDTEMPPAATDRVLAKLFPAETIAVPIRKMPHRSRWWAAAAVLLLAGSATWYWKTTPPPAPPVVKVQPGAMPGGNKAVLILANGSTITLDSAQNGALALQGGTQVSKLANGQLAYTTGNTNTKEVLYNTIATPRGGQYQITLPDGTKVWMNAASSLRFPAAFTGSQREVELTGEAYFEVAQAANMPFQITVKGMKIAVLGTSFNVNAYDDESSIRTTLVSGSVKLMKATTTQLLRPGQQAQLNTQGNWQVATVADMESVLAWKNGRFQFEEAEIAQVMRQIARWYNVEIVYQGAIIKQHFNGGISRDVPLSKVFKMLEATGAAHFTLENGKVIVQP
jgi:transmembrane sensor